MTLLEFKLLPEPEKYDLIYIKGIFSDIQLAPNTRFTLYSLNMFFIEVEYNFGTKKIVSKEFIYGEILDK